jgi:peptide/nickel transport system substrate-binding protein
MIAYRLAVALASSLLLILPVRGEDVLRIAMTASDIPTTTGMPNNGFEGMRASARARLKAQNRR